MVFLPPDLPKFAQKYFVRRLQIISKWQQMIEDIKFTLGDAYLPVYNDIFLKKR